MAYKIILDPGHGGSDPGATFNGRQEKDEALGLAMSVGKLLENAGFDVAYTRTADVYDTPFEKATIANNMGEIYLFHSIEILHLTQTCTTECKHWCTMTRD